MNKEQFELQPKEVMEYVKRAEEEKKEVYIGSITPHRGHKLFEVDCNSGEIRLPEYKAVEVKYDPQWTKEKTSGTNKKLMMKPNCIYISALNKQNVVKHVKKGSIGSKFK